MVSSAGHHRIIFRLWVSILLLLGGAISRICEGSRSNDSAHNSIFNQQRRSATSKFVGNTSTRKKNHAQSFIFDNHIDAHHIGSLRGGGSNNFFRRDKKCLECYVGLDVGTQGTKCVAYCPDEQRIVARASASYDILPSNVPGRAEQDPQVWLYAVEECLTSIGKQLSTPSRMEEETEESSSSSVNRYRVAGIGVSGQQHGLVVLDEFGQPMRPAKLWCDVEASDETDWLKEQATKLQEQNQQRDDEGGGSSDWKNLDRSFLTPGFTSPKILWLKRNEPDVFEKCRWMVLPHDYIVMKLTSSLESGDMVDASQLQLQQPITDVGDASGNGIFDPVTKTNIKELADQIAPDLLDKFPKIVQRPNEIAGYLNDYYAGKVLNIDSKAVGGSYRIPISIGSGDNMCSCLGIGCVTPGTSAVLSLGTSGTVFGVSKTPVNSLEAPSLAPFCDATGNYLPLACIMSCTGVLTSVLNEWCPSDWSHTDATTAATENVEIGCSGITCLPFWGGERTPNIPHATGAFLGITPTNLKQQHGKDEDYSVLSNDEYRGAVLYRACMEGITFCLADALRQFPNHETITTLYVVGGGSKNPLWRQMIADIFNCRLVFPVETETGALGAAFQAGAAATGTDVADFVQQQTILFEPTIVEPQYHELYQEAHERYRKYVKLLYYS